MTAFLLHSRSVVRPALSVWCWHHFNQTMGFYVATILGLLVLLGLLWLVLSSRSHKRHSSTDNLMGASAIVDQPLNPKGSVIVEGEVWLALSASGKHLAKSTAVKVVGLRDQFLVVED